MTTWACPERRKMLQELLAKGLSASQIAVQIGGVSRNAVISAAHRYGYYRRDHRRAKAWATTSVPPRVPPHPNRPPDDAERPIRYIEVDVPSDERKTILDLQPDDCRWPIGDPQQSDFTFCNQKKIIGKPYCAHHCAIAYQPPVPATRTHHATHCVINPVRETEDA